MTFKDEEKAWFRTIYDPFLPLSDRMRRGEGFADLGRKKKGHILDESIAPLDANTIEVVGDPTLVRLWGLFRWWAIEWKTNSTAPAEAKGSFELLPPERVLNDAWDEDLGGNDWAPHMKGFRPVDMFYDSDGFVGFYLGRQDEGFYLVHSDSSVSPLHVNFDGYLQLFAMARAYGWWQNALVEIATGASMPNVKEFRADMPLLFEDFSFEEFEHRYHALRIDQ
jgi:hypothetical protein